MGDISVFDYWAEPVYAGYPFHRTVFVVVWFTAILFIYAGAKAYQYGTRLRQSNQISG